MWVIYLIYHINNNIFQHFLNFNVCGQMTPVRDKCLSFSVITIGITVNNLFKIQKWHLTADVFPNLLHKSFWKKRGISHESSGPRKYKMRCKATFWFTVQWKINTNTGVERRQPRRATTVSARGNAGALRRQVSNYLPTTPTKTEPLPRALRFSAWLEI